jgi:hypothetical protein
MATSSQPDRLQRLKGLLHGSRPDQPTGDTALLPRTPVPAGLHVRTPAIARLWSGWAAAVADDDHIVDTAAELGW